MQTETLSHAGTLASEGVPEGAPALPPRISWGAILAGGLVAVAVGAMLNILGLAVGATTLDLARPGGSPGAGMLGMAGGIWLLVANLIGLGVGGWVAARLSGTADDTDGELHGLAVWATGFLVSALLLGNVVMGAANLAVGGAGAAFGGAGQAVGEAARALAPRLGVPADPQVLAERLRLGLETGGEPAAMSAEARRAEMTRILAQRLRQGDFLPGQRERLSALVGAEYGLPANEAQARIARLEGEARQIAGQVETEARAAAEAASDAAATAAYWIFAALVLGAAAAVLGARLGTRRTLRRHVAPETAYG